MAEASVTGPQAPPPPTPIAGLGVAAVVVTAIFAWVLLAGRFLSEPALFGGFMMLWYWAKVEHLAMRRLPACVLGGLMGIGLACAMHYAAIAFGPTGFVAGLILLIIAIYLDIVQIFPTWINAATMLYSIVAAAPLIQLRINWFELAAAAAGGGLFFGAYVAAVLWLAGRTQAGPATKPAA
jgi:hypothetical protein